MKPIIFYTLSLRKRQSELGEASFVATDFLLDQHLSGLIWVIIQSLLSLFSLVLLLVLELEPSASPTVSMYSATEQNPQF